MTIPATIRPVPRPHERKQPGCAQAHRRSQVAEYPEPEQATRDAVDAPPEASRARPVTNSMVARPQQ